jgi:hypothetical protein
LANTFARQGTSTNNLGFRGKEDLGGGMYAGFNLQTGGLDLATGSPALAFSRESNLSLGGTWGELKVGRSSSTFCTIGCSFDYNYIGAGSALAINGLSPAAQRGSSRRTGQIEFSTVNMNGFKGYLTLQPRTASNADNSFATNSGLSYTASSTISGTSTTAANYKDVVTVGGSYTQGKLRVAGVMEQAFVMTPAVRNGMWMGAEYDFGFMKANIQSMTNSNVASYSINGVDKTATAVGSTSLSTATGATTYGKGTSFALVAPVTTSLNVGLQYSKNTETTVKGQELFAQYSLSKRTTIYAYNTKFNGTVDVKADATVADLAAAGAAGFPIKKGALQADPSITAIGIRHTF